MAEQLVLPTERADVSLKEMVDIGDDIAYFLLVDANREHLSRHGDATSGKYPSIESVTKAREEAGDKLRMGIWGAREGQNGMMVGTIHARPNEDKTEVELGYLLGKQYLGQGYATIAVRALTAHLTDQYERITADVHTQNIASMRVLERAGFIAVEYGEKFWGPAITFEPSPSPDEAFTIR